MIVTFPFPTRIPPSRTTGESIVHGPTRHRWQISIDSPAAARSSKQAVNVTTWHRDFPTSNTVTIVNPSHSPGWLIRRWWNCLFYRALKKTRMLVLSTAPKTWNNTDEDSKMQKPVFGRTCPAFFLTFLICMNSQHIGRHRCKTKRSSQE